MLDPTLRFLGLTLQPPPLFIILTGNKIYGLSIVLEAAAAFHLPFPLFFAELSPALWDLVKTKSHYREESGLAQPTGNMCVHKCKGLLYSVPLCFSRAMIGSTLPMQIALNTKSAYRLFLRGNVQGFKLQGLNLDFPQKILFLSEKCYLSFCIKHD